MSARDALPLIRYSLTALLVLTCAAKLLLYPRLSWVVVLAPAWVPFLAALVLPLIPGYRRWAERHDMVSGR